MTHFELTLAGLRCRAEAVTGRVRTVAGDIMEPIPVRAWIVNRDIVNGRPIICRWSPRWPVWTSRLGAPLPVYAPVGFKHCLLYRSLQLDVLREELKSAHASVSQWRSQATDAATRADGMAKRLADTEQKLFAAEQRVTGAQRMEKEAHQKALSEHKESEFFKVQVDRIREVCTQCLCGSLNIR